MTGLALIVDNDGVWRDFLIRTIDRMGLKSNSASTPQRAIELVKKHNHTIALLDADLGTEQGAYGCSEILAELKAKGTEIPVIIVSGVENVRSLSKNLERHYQNLADFTKGDNLLELEELIRRLLGTIANPRPERATDLSDLAEYVSYEFAFLKLDIVGHSAIYEANRSPNIDETLEAFEKLVEAQINNFQGHILSWQGDGGVAVFVAGDKVQNCAEAALAILYSLRKFNDNENKTNEEIKVRLACHQGTAKYKSNHGRIHSSALNFVCHLEAKGTSVNAISVSDMFYKELPDKVKARFGQKGKFENTDVYEYKISVS